MTLTVTSNCVNTVQQKATTTPTSLNTEVGEIFTETKTNNTKNEKEIAKVEAKIAEKTEKLNELLDKINKNEYTRSDKEVVARDKHAIAYYGSQISQSVGIVGAAALIGGISTGNGIIAMVGGVGAAIGAVAGLGFTLYFDHKGNNITNEEVKSFYTQQANTLSAEIAELKQELSSLNK